MARVYGFCVDRYEAPNVAGEFPLVMENAYTAEAWCQRRGKRLCGEDEWEDTVKPRLFAAGADLTKVYRVNPVEIEFKGKKTQRALALDQDIEAIKESSGKLPQIAELVRILPAGFKVFSGDDNLALASIGVGAHGLVSVAANEIPSEMASMIRAALSNQWPQARDLERRYSRLIEANFWDSNPSPVKTILNLMGRCSDHVRLPLVLPSLATRARLERVAGELNLLKHAPLPDDYVGLF